MNPDINENETLRPDQTSVHSCLLFSKDGFSSQRRTDDGIHACDADIAQLVPGQMVDRYRLERKIADGGMGQVWLALQQQPIKREVAIKLIHPDRLTKRARRRFARECQTLALLDHPNICTVLDAGTTDGDMPYLVLQHLEGMPITDYCDKNQLPIFQRLQLFNQVCDAIQYAHDRDIYHRDIKPANILVSEVAGRPSVKIIDFGLSKLNASSLSWNDLTYDGEVIGTLRYMSPEHASRGNEGIGVPSEVYSLGVVLFELLVGQTPQSPEESDSLGQFLHSLRSSVSIRPSQLIVTENNQLDRILQLRNEKAESLLRVLQLDLDWVVLKALNRNAKHRYQTVTELQEDLQLYLSGQPVDCRHSELGYQVRRQFARWLPKIPAAAAALSLMTICIWVGTWISNEPKLSNKSTLFENGSKQPFAEGPEQTLVSERIPEALPTQVKSSETRSDRAATGQHPTFHAELTDPKIESNVAQSKLILQIRSETIEDLTLEACQERVEELLNIGEPELAAEYAEAVINRLEDPDNSSSNNSEVVILAERDMGRCEVAAGKWNKAKRRFQRLRHSTIHMSKLDRQLVLDMAHVLQLENEYKSAAKYLEALEDHFYKDVFYQRQATIGSELVLVRQQLAIVYWNIGRFQKAHELAAKNLREAQTARHNFPDAYGQLTEFLPALTFDELMLGYGVNRTDLNGRRLVNHIQSADTNELITLLQDTHRTPVFLQLAETLDNPMLLKCFSEILDSLQNTTDASANLLALRIKIHLSGVYSDNQFQTLSQDQVERLLELLATPTRSNEEVLELDGVVETLRTQPVWSCIRDETELLLSQQLQQHTLHQSDFNLGAIALKLQLIRCNISFLEIGAATIKNLYEQAFRITGRKHWLSERLYSHPVFLNQEENQFAKTRVQVANPAK